MIKYIFREDFLLFSHMSLKVQDHFKVNLRLRYFWTIQMIKIQLQIYRNAGKQACSCEFSETSFFPFWTMPKVISFVVSGGGDGKMVGQFYFKVTPILRWESFGALGLWRYISYSTP